MAKSKGRTQSRKSKSPEDPRGRTQAPEDPKPGAQPGEDPDSGKPQGRTQPGDIDGGGPKASEPGDSVHTGEGSGVESGSSEGQSGAAAEGQSKSSSTDRKRSPRGSRPQRTDSAPRCTATSKSTGERCKKYPLRGQTVCKYHGGNNAVSKAAGERRIRKREALAQANRLVQRDGVDMDPIDHLLDSLYRAAQMVRVYGIMCAEIDDSADEELSDDKTRGELGYHVVTEEVGEGREIERFLVQSKDKLLTLNKHSEAQLHPFLVAYAEANRDRAKFAKMCIDAGIAKMQMELVERQVDMAQEALEATIVEMALNAADRKKFVEAYARNLRELGTQGTGISPRALSAGARS